MVKSFKTTDNIFQDETVLSDDYVPVEMPEREKELDALTDALQPALRGACPHNTFIYGKTGQGKTVAVEHRLNELKEATEGQDVDLSVFNYSCAKDNTSYQVVSNLIDEITGDRPWGIPKAALFDKLYEALQDIGGTVILVLDEIDSIGTDDDILYELPRARSNGHIEDMYVSVIGISNDFNFRDNLSPKVKDTLAEEEIHFTPYNANQLKPILQRRAEKAFQDDVLSDDVIPLCAAFAGQDKGSARQAIRYLYSAGELATNSGDEKVTESHVREAENKIERKNIEVGMRDLTVQDHLALAAVLSLEIKGVTPARTRKVHSEYKKLSNLVDARTIVMRRVRDHLQELDLNGIVVQRKQSSGIQGGPHYQWEFDSDIGITIEILQEDARLDEAIDRIKSSSSLEKEWRS